MCSQILGAISIAIFAFATWIGFVPLDKEASDPNLRFNPNSPENRLKERANKVFQKVHWDWPIKTPYALTKILIGVATVLGIIAIFLSN